MLECTTVWQPPMGFPYPTNMDIYLGMGYHLRNIDLVKLA